jgi:hypothetical protein
MIKILPLLLLLMSFASAAKSQYKTCTVHCENHLAPKWSGTAKRQVFNKYGKLIYEQQYGRQTYSDTGADYSTSVTSKKIFNSYKQDTILLKSVSTYPNPYLDRDPYKQDTTDTMLEVFYYGQNGLLDSSLQCYFGQHRIGCLADIDEPSNWGDSTITHYIYNNKKHLTEKYVQAVSMLSSGGIGSVSSNKSSYYYNKKDELDSVVNYHIISLDLPPCPKNCPNCKQDFGGLQDTFLASKWKYAYNVLSYEKIRQEYGILSTNATETYNLDARNRIIEEHIPNTDGDETIVRQYKYDPYKRIVNEKLYNDKGVLKETFTYTYQ